jgi:hypothetical protein
MVPSIPSNSSFLLRILTLHHLEPIYRQAEQEWKDFIEEFTPLLTSADSQMPTLPSKDVIHRIYRDVRTILEANYMLSCCN